jgi:5S rRNA maturation endonuclease (ribonuclease M5)
MTPVERVTSALEQAGSKKRGPASWTCPAHDDAKASLSVSAGRDDRALVRCHAGCQLDDILDALALARTDLFPEKAKRAEIVATYDYTDEHGTLLYQVVRFSPKGFRQRRPDGHGGWVWSLKGTRRVLFHLPQVLAAIAEGREVWVAEGEKDVLALEKAGVVATTCPMGAGKWRREYSETLAGARVMVVADADTAGHDHARHVARDLERHRATVAVVQPASGKDAADHLAAGLELAEFVPLGSQLADGPTVADLVKVLDSYQHLDDTGHVWFSLAVAVSGEAEVEPFLSDPLWGMLVGPSSSGKTETARSLGNVAGYVDDLTGAALLSFTKGKNPRQTGVLMRLPDASDGNGKRGTLTIGDFSTVLAQSNRGAKDQLFSLLRRAYDGAVYRDVGNMKQQLSWRGRVTILACVTPIIDDYTSHADSLGPRWLYYRLKPRTLDGMRSMAAAARVSATEGRNESAELAERLINQAAARASDVTISSAAAEHITDLAIVACYGRAAVPRSSFGKREILGEATREEPARLTKQLRQLVHALLALGATTDQALGLARRCALDSLPQTRRRALELFAAAVPLTASEVAKELGCDRRVARFALEELAAAGVLDWPESYTTEDDSEENRWAPRSWHLSEAVGGLFTRILTGQPWEQKYVLHPQPPPEGGEEEAEQTRTPHFMSQGSPAAEQLFDPPRDPRRHQR